jgi:DNA-binding XRE family transcriptional regulator
MSEPTKGLTTPEYAEICLKVPVAYADRIRAAINGIPALVEEPGSGFGQEDDNRLYSPEEVFPHFHVGDILKGFRSREEPTQAQLAARVGVKVSHISEMERGKRPIGKEMARRLGQTLGVGYKVFL